MMHLSLRRFVTSPTVTLLRDPSLVGVTDVLRRQECWTGNVSRTHAYTHTQKKLISDKQQATLETFTARLNKGCEQ